MMLHAELAARLADSDDPALAALQPQLRHDALEFMFANGVILRIRFAAPDAYSLRWQVGDAEYGIDTAPTHPALASAPSHLHLPDGRVVADPLTRCGAEPWDNLVAVLHALLREPRLEAV